MQRKSQIRTGPNLGGEQKRETSRQTSTWLARGSGDGLTLGGPLMWKMLMFLQAMLCSMLPAARVMYSVMKEKSSKEKNKRGTGSCSRRRQKFHGLKKYSSGKKTETLAPGRVRCHTCLCRALWRGWSSPRYQVKIRQIRSGSCSQQPAPDMLIRAEP